MGTTQGGRDIASVGVTNHRVDVTGLPSSGTLYVKYWTLGADGCSESTDHVYTMDVSTGGGGGEGHHTLRWDQKLSTAERFVLVLGGNSVSDIETGLVWQRFPQAGATSAFAPAFCINRVLDGRIGWRLLSVHELASLIGADANPAIALNMPNGPFENVQGDWYWSATASSGNPNFAWAVNLGNGEVDINPRTDFNHLWCVRGGGLLSEY